VGTAEEFVLFYAPLGMSFIMNVGIYVFLFFSVHKVSFFSSQPEAVMNESEELQRAKRERAMNWRVRRRLLMYIGVFIVTSIFGFAGRVYQVLLAIIHHTEVGAQVPPMWLIYVDAALGPLQGFLNAFVYGVNPQLCQQYSNKLHVLCSRVCCRRGGVAGSNSGADYLLRQPEDDDYESGGSPRTGSNDTDRPGTYDDSGSAFSSSASSYASRPSSFIAPNMGSSSSNAYDSREYYENRGNSGNHGGVGRSGTYTRA
jgi:hypothetical protein